MKTTTNYTIHFTEKDNSRGVKFGISIKRIFVQDYNIHKRNMDSGPIQHIEKLQEKFKNFCPKDPQKTLAWSYSSC